MFDASEAAPNIKAQNEVLALLLAEALTSARIWKRLESNHICLTPFTMDSTHAYPFLI